MKNRASVAGLALILALAAACAAPSPTATPSVPPTPTPAPAQLSPTVPAPLPTPDPSSLPSWLNDLIFKLSNEPVTDPPLSIASYDYKGQVVYYLPPRCCDIFSDLYDARGVLLGHPDGGIAGHGDGKVPDFLQERKNERMVWRDNRTRNPSMVLAGAPVQSIDILTVESAPPQYKVAVVSTLNNGCITFAGYRLQRNGQIIVIEVFNWKPARTGVLCTEVFNTVKTEVPLGSDFKPGVTYSVAVNDKATSFVGK